MTDRLPDPFAPLEHAELMRARVATLSFPDMGGVIVRAAETVMTMPESDLRRPYAQEYLGRMLDTLNEREEINRLEDALNPPSRWRREAGVMLMFLYGVASTSMRHEYGGTDPFSAVDVERGLYDAEVARLATEGMAAADAVLTREMFGFTA
ncbi:MAG TPA: hypothetical protein VL737_01210 [Candidatus Pristimantibacillus sp.]|jgi:hypothetical protein|nr:hypothetical protein [Candidatus Pristimantibacillus sp.]